MLLKTPIMLTMPDELESRTFFELPVTIMDDSANKKVQVQLKPFMKTLVLWQGNDYDAIGDYTQTQVEDRINELIDSPAKLLSLYVNTAPSPNYNNPLSCTYSTPTNTDSIIIISYFSPCNYQKPKQNLLDIVKKLVQSQHRVFVIEAILPGSDQLELPPYIQHHKIYGNFNNVMFLKENLYNIATNYLINNSSYTKFIYLDSDVIFDKSTWFDETSKLLDTHDIIQPFEYAYWASKNNQAYHLQKTCAIKCLINKKTPYLGRYHPGFCWAMTKECYTKINGFYDQHIIGGGDLGLWCALDKYSSMDTDFKFNENNHFYQTQSYQTYKKNINQYDLKIGYIRDCCALHLYHGDAKNRKYNSRYNIISITHGSEYPIRKNESGLWEWINKTDAQKCYNYFLERQEDE